MEIKNSEKDLEASETATEEIKQSNTAQPETKKLEQKADTQSHTESQNIQKQDSIKENPTETITQPHGSKTENKKEPQLVNDKQKNKKTSKTIHEAIKNGTQISKENKEKTLQKLKSNKISAKKNPQTNSELRKDIEHIDITELEISDSIQNGTQINRGRVMEILELMRDNESKSRHTISSEKNDTTIGKNSTDKSLEPIIEIKNNIDENVQEISKAIQKGNKISKEKKTEILERMEGHKPESSQIDKQQAEDKIIVSWPIACEM